jgi:hypothetical protein
MSSDMGLILAIIIVADALCQIKQGAEDKPNEIYLLSSVVKTPWWLLTMRVDDHVYDDFNLFGGLAAQNRPGHARFTDRRVCGLRCA